MSKLEKNARAVGGLSSFGDFLVLALSGAIEAFQRDIAPKLLKEFGRIATETLEEFNETYPSNWHRLTIPEMFKVMDLMGETGWSLLWTPPAEILAEIIATSDRAAQEAILLRWEALILDDLGALLERVEHQDLREFRVPVAEAIEVYRSGFFWSAQALATATLTTMNPRGLRTPEVQTRSRRLRAHEPARSGRAQHPPLGAAQGGLPHP